MLYPLPWYTTLKYHKGIIPLQIFRIELITQLPEPVLCVFQFRRWLRMKYSNNPFNDQEAVCKMLRQFEEQEQQQHLRNGEQSWTNHTTTIYPLPYNTYGSANSRWVSRSEP
ncbi:UNVERIFIED_CONTAM: hypothetical protein FKN15_046917 [Acipenser sinensis]